MIWLRARKGSSSVNTKSWGLIKHHSQVWSSSLILHLRGGDAGAGEAHEGEVLRVAADVRQVDGDHLQHHNINTSHNIIKTG